MEDTAGGGLDVCLKGVIYSFSLMSHTFNLSAHWQAKEWEMSSKQHMIEKYFHIVCGDTLNNVEKMLLIS